MSAAAAVSSPVSNHTRSHSGGAGTAGGQPEVTSAGLGASRRSSRILQRVSVARPFASQPLPGPLSGSKIALPARPASQSARAALPPATLTGPQRSAAAAVTLALLQAGAQRAPAPEQPGPPPGPPPGPFRLPSAPRSMAPASVEQARALAETDPAMRHAPLRCAICKRGASTGGPLKGATGLVAHLRTAHAAAVGSEALAGEVDRPINFQDNSIVYTWPTGRVLMQLSPRAEASGSGVAPPSLPPPPSATQLLQSLDTPKLIDLIMTNPLPLRLTIPSSASLDTALANILQSIASSDLTIQLMGARKWLLFHLLVLHRRPTGDDGQGHGTTLADSELAARLERFNQGELVSLFQDYERHRATYVRGGGSGSTPLKAFIKDCDANNWSDALKRFFQGLSRATTTPAVQQEMLRCFPQRVDLAGDRLFILDPDVINYKALRSHTVSADVLRAVIAAMKLNRAGGLSHLRTDHLRAVLTDEGSKSFDALLKVIQRLVDGAMQPSVIELLNLCILHPLVSANKPDKRRPVTCVEFILQVMERYMYQQARPTLQPILEAAGQFGFGTPGGQEGLIHAYRGVLESFPLEAVMLLGDLDTAYSLADRQPVVDFLAANSDLEWMIPGLRTSLAYNPRLLMQVAEGHIEIEAAEGFLQGKCGSAPGFCVTQLNAMRGLLKARQELNGDSYALLVGAIMDDISWFTTLDRVEESLDKFRSDVALVGGVLNLTKTKVFAPGLRLPDRLRERFTVRRADGSVLINYVDIDTPEAERGVINCGSPLGTPAFIRSVVKSKLDAAVSQMQALASALPGKVHYGFKTFDYCFIGKATHLARTVPTCIIMDLLADYDKSMAQALLDLIGKGDISENHPARAQIALPKRMGGMGLGSVAKVAHAAYVASLFESARLFKNLGTSWLYTPMAQRVPTQSAQTWLEREFLSASGAILSYYCVPVPEAEGESPSRLNAEGLRSAGIPAFLSPAFNHLALSVLSLPSKSRKVLLEFSRAADVASTPAAAAQVADLEDEAGSGPKLQYMLSQSIREAQLKAYETIIRLDQSRTAQHLSQVKGEGKKSGQGYFSYQWLNITPGQRRIDNSVYIFGILERLGLQLPGIMVGDKCSCGKRLDDSNAWPHVHACNDNNKTVIHTQVGRALQTIYLSLGCITDWERKDCPCKGDKMDLWVHGAPHISGSRALLIDYTISNPASDTLRGNASAVPQLAANRGHEAKTARYSTSIDKTTSVFLPFSAELPGSTTQEVVKDMREMAEAAMEERNGTKRDAARLLNGWRSLLSVSLLEGKAKLVFKAQAKRERGPIGDAERRKQLGLLRDESWAVRIKKGRTATRTVATGLG